MSVLESEPIGNFFKNLDELLGRLKITIIFFLIIFFGTFLIGPTRVNWLGYDGYLPLPNFFNSFSVLLLRFIESTLVPKGMILINVAPFDIVVSDVYVALSLSISLTMPVMVYQVFKFATPGMYLKERRAVRFSLLPIAVLFIAGVLFAYILIIPLLLHVIYEFALNLKVEPTMGIKDFVSIILLISVGMGVIFETPVIIVTLSYLRIVKPDFWFRQWRYAIIGAFFAALLISPGATGGIMETTIATIIIILYFAGALVARRFYRKE
ncbi:MAG: twin-arginine translocase subunit TatC [Candidatus Thermoplasmatota archaeon]|nr:twin-arginine translocase subunit TatC [Candidatus Thermoplasmatota archaeon]MCL5680858.1 twin-arginine translocase subunit TatC [Candidatus Thermoplasmatota archaeon]